MVLFNVLCTTKVFSLKIRVQDLQSLDLSPTNVPVRERLPRSPLRQETEEVEDYRRTVKN